MEVTILEYIFIITNIIVVGGIILYFIFGSRLLRREGFNLFGKDFPDPPSPNQIKDNLEKPFKELANKMDDGFDKMGNAIKDVANKAKDTLMGPLMDIFDKATKAFEQIPKRFTAFGNGFKRVFDGIGQEFNGLTDGLHDSFNDIGTLIEYSGLFVFSYIQCGVQLLQNLHVCIFYYSLQAVGQCFYLPIRLLLWLISLTGLDLYSTETIVWNHIEVLDSIVYKNVGFHFSHYPKSIRNQCYNCRRMKQSTVVNVANKIDTDFRTEIPDKLKRGINTIKDGGEEIKSAFRPGYI